MSSRWKYGWLETKAEREQRKLDEQQSSEFQDGSGRNQPNGQNPAPSKQNIRNQPNVPIKPPVKKVLQPGSQQDQLDRIEQQMKEQIEQKGMLEKEQIEQEVMFEAILKHLEVSDVKKEQREQK